MPTDVWDMYTSQANYDTNYSNVTFSNFGPDDIGNAYTDSIAIVDTYGDTIGVTHIHTVEFALGASNCNTQLNCHNNTNALAIEFAVETCNYFTICTAL